MSHKAEQLYQIPVPERCCQQRPVVVLRKSQHFQDEIDHTCQGGTLPRLSVSGPTCERNIIVARSRKYAYTANASSRANDMAA